MWKVKVPIFHENRRCTLLLALTAHREERRVDHLDKRNRSRTLGVRCLDWATSRTKFGNTDADTTRTLSDPHSVANRPSNRVHIVFNIKQKAV